jgi:FG-GAP repeat
LLDDGTAGLDQGSAYVFVRSAGVWSQQQKLVAADAASNDNFGDNFGNSVAISGETLVVGAPFHAGTAGLNRGSAYVFVRNGEVWSEQQKLLAADAASEDGFGFSVTISGETLVVDAPFKAGLPQGSAYIFVHSGGVWSQQQKLLASDAAKPGNFGYSWRSAGRRSWSAHRLRMRAFNFKARPMSLPLRRPRLTPRRQSPSKLQSRSGRPITNTTPWTLARCWRVRATLRTARSGVLAVEDPPALTVTSACRVNPETM